MVLNVSLGTSFNNIKEWKGRWKNGEWGMLGNIIA
jgi:hypothetical protein